MGLSPEEKANPIEPTLISVDAAREALGGIGVATIYDLLNSGKLDAVKLGVRTMVRVDSIRALPAKLTSYTEAREADGKIVKRGL